MYLYNVVLLDNEIVMNYLYIQQKRLNLKTKQNTVLSGRTQGKKTLHTLQFHLYKVFEQAKLR